MNVDICGLSVKYKNTAGIVTAIDGLDLNIKSGGICAVIGPSGCGKTTLVYVLSGIINDYEGEAHLDGARVHPRRQRIGLIPQNYGLLEWANVYQNIALGLEVKNNKKSVDRREIEALLSQLGLTGTERQYPCSLSGGQRQRISIARSFLMKPDILLMDEPFSALDAITREYAQDLFLSIWRERPVTAVIVTHSIEEAVYLGQNIAVMSPAPGRILDVYDNPLFGGEELRISGAYYEMVTAFRRKAKELWIKCASPK